MWGTNLKVDKNHWFSLYGGFEVQFEVLRSEPQSGQNHWFSLYAGFEVRFEVRDEFERRTSKWLKNVSFMCLRALRFALRF